MVKRSPPELQATPLPARREWAPRHLPLRPSRRTADLGRYRNDLCCAFRTV